MPCYDPPPTTEELERLYQCWPQLWYEQVSRKDLEQWLCDALQNGGQPSHENCARWFKLHRAKESK